MWKCGNVEIPILCYDKISIKLSPKGQETEVNHKEYLWILFLFSWRSNSLVSSGLWKLESLPNSVCTTSDSRFLPESFLHLCSSGHRRRQGHQGEIFLCPLMWLGDGKPFGFAKWVVFILSQMPGPSSWVGWFPLNFAHISQGRQRVKQGYGLCFNWKSWK